METKDPKSTESADVERSAESTDPKSDATSSDTLSDVEETEKVSDTSESTTGEAEQSPLPSPDGAFDEGRGSGGGIEDAGPM
jgi:TFIIF-interacting CTD phosphatase-like protein